MRRGIWIGLAALFLTGCAGVALSIPSPFDQGSAGLVINLKVRVSGIATYRADVVYFVKDCPNSSESCDRLFSSNYAKDGRVYLLNAEPGEYRAVATAFESGMFGDSSLYFAYFPSQLSIDSATRVHPRHLADAGSYLLAASLGVCPESAEPDQLRYAALIEPGTPKCGFFNTLMHKLGSADYIFIGGKAYSVGKQTFHYRATAYEKQATDSPYDFLEAARRDLAGTGWEAFTKTGD